MDLCLQRYSVHRLLGIIEDREYVQKRLKLSKQEGVEEIDAETKAEIEQLKLR